MLIDESTEISVTKLLGVTVRYYSRELGKIVATFLAIAELEDGTALSIVSAIKQVLCDVQLDPENLLGVGVDNANVNVGINNGVCEMLKKDLERPKFDHGALCLPLASAGRVSCCSKNTSEEY